MRLFSLGFIWKKNNIFHLLRSFYDIMQLEVRKQELTYYFDFSKEEKLEEGARNVVNIGTYMREKMIFYHM